jgi:hypothetical protein
MLGGPHEHLPVSKPVLTMTRQQKGGCKSLTKRGLRPTMPGGPDEHLPVRTCFGAHAKSGLDAKQK